MRWTGKSFLGRQALFILGLHSFECHSRLKKVQGKKKRDTAARDAARSVIEETTAEREPEITPDMLRSKDEDIIF